MTISSKDILDVATAVTKTWTKQRKAEERGSRSRASRAHVYSDTVHFTDAAHSILPKRYAEVSSDGRYTVSKRHFYYAVRDDFLKHTGEELPFAYFAGTLLVQYMNRNQKVSANWRITADPRGTLIIPNAGHDERIPVGTLQIDKYLNAIAESKDPLDITALLRTEWPSLAPGDRYQAVLYIEKEGFGPLIEDACIAERFDIAVISCKGQSVVAARKLVDFVCAVGNNCPLFIVHDMDKYGFEISQRLVSVAEWAEEKDRVAYRFRNTIDVTDLGLRLEDAKRYGLKGEPWRFKGRFASDSIATKEEKEYLRSNRRVELNELPPHQFIEWLEGKLKQRLPERLIPKPEVLDDAYRRAYAIAKLNRAIEEVRDEAIEEARNLEIPSDIRDRLREAMAKGETAWDEALYELLKTELESKLSEEEGD